MSSIVKAGGKIIKGGLGVIGGAMNSMLGVKQPDAPVLATPNAPAAPVPLAGGVPDKNTAQANIDLAAQQSDAQDAERRKKGRASTILTGERGAGTPITATKALLGD